MGILSEMRHVIISSVLYLVYEVEISYPADDYRPIPQVLGHSLL